MFPLQLYWISIKLVIHLQIRKSLYNVCIYLYVIECLSNVVGLPHIIFQRFIYSRVWRISLNCRNSRISFLCRNLKIIHFGYVLLEGLVYLT